MNDINKAGLEVRKIKQHVYAASEKGLVTLVQKKHADFDYEYIAVRI